MMQEPRSTALARLRRETDQLLEPGVSNSLAAHAVHIGLALIIAISVGAMILKSVPSYEAQWGWLFHGIEWLAILVFTVEYALRIWSAPEHCLYDDLGETRARWHYIVSPSGLIDLLSILPLYIALFVDVDLRALLLFRLLRYFKLARYSAGMRSLISALQLERRALLAAMVVLLGAVIIAASLMHIVEGEAQPDKLGTIPDSMWWAVVTLTTVGYGDVVPVTIAGRIVAAFAMITGLMMLALPVGIIATAFAEEIHRREFVVNWGMLARVPLFATLSAPEIAELMRYLRAQNVPAGAVIFRRGDPATSMYFIADGEVHLDTPNGAMDLGEGHFFGEVVLMERTQRVASARAARPSKLLILDMVDVFSLMEKNEDIRTRIEQAAAQRGLNVT